MNSSFFDLPQDLAISAKAQAEFDRYRDGGDEQLAAETIIEGHMAHLAQLRIKVAAENPGITEAAYVTFVEDYQLAVIDMIVPFASGGKTPRYTVLTTPGEVQTVISSLGLWITQKMSEQGSKNEPKH